jgi:hypothetical protein
LIERRGEERRVEKTREVKNRKVITLEVRGKL